MKIQLTIIGLGQIGASAGLALSEFKESILRVGHDKSRDAVNLAKKTEAVDKIALTLSGAVKEAEVFYLYVGCAVLLVRLPFSLAIPHFVSTALGAVSRGDFAGARMEVLLLLILGVSIVYNCDARYFDNSDSLRCSTNTDHRRGIGFLVRFPLWLRQP